MWIIVITLHPLSFIRYPHHKLLHFSFPLWNLFFFFCWNIHGSNRFACSSYSFKDIKGPFFLSHHPKYWILNLMSNFNILISTPDPKDMAITSCSLVRPLYVVTFTFQYYHLKLCYQIKSNLAGMILGWSSFKIVSDSLALIAFYSSIQDGCCN